MPEFYNQVGAIKQLHVKAKDKLDEMVKLRQEAAGKVDWLNNSSTIMSQLSVEASGILKLSMEQIDAMKIENEEKLKCKNPSENKIRKGMYQSLLRQLEVIRTKLFAEMKQFQDDVNKRKRKQLKYACPELTEKQVEEIIREGDEAVQQVLRRKCRRETHRSVKDALQKMQDRYKDVRHLEKAMQEVYQLMHDMALLTEHQGELVDSIACQVVKAHSNIKDGSIYLEQAHLRKKKKQKLVCCGTVGCAVSIGIICISLTFSGHITLF